jgi:hypothetical protein
MEEGIVESVILDGSELDYEIDVDHYDTGKRLNINITTPPEQILDMIGLPTVLAWVKEQT